MPRLYSLQNMMYEGMFMLQFISNVLYTQIGRQFGYFGDIIEFWVLGMVLWVLNMKGSKEPTLF